MGSISVPHALPAGRALDIRTRERSFYVELATSKELNAYSSINICFMKE